MIELIVKKDDREINRYFLPQGITTLGRAEDNGIILDDSCVSRRHARIKVDGTKVQIEDLGSGNGTYQGEQKIEKVELSDGDEVLIEPFKLILKKDQAAKQDDLGRTRPAPAAGFKPSSRLDAPPPAAREPGGSAAGGVRLEVIRGQGGPYLLTEEEAEMGRSDECKIALRDPSASRRHASVRRGSRGWMCRDLGSANGTYVNGAVVQETVLTDGDIILIGNTELRFVDPAAQSRATAEPQTPVPSTRPVVRGGKRPPPQPIEPPEEPAPRGYAEMEMSGGMEMGAMPVEASGGSGGTEVGPPPPSAFGDAAPEATGEGEYDQVNGGGYSEMGDGGYGMELGEGALFPGGQRPPNSLLGRYIYSFKTNNRTKILTIAVAAIFVIILYGKSQTGAVGGHGPSNLCNNDNCLDKQQKMTLEDMRFFIRDADAAVNASPRDLPTAFDRYTKIYEFAHRPEMVSIEEARVLGRKAETSLYNLHEGLVLQRLQEVTSHSADLDAKAKARFNKDMNDGRAALERARRRPRTTDFQQAINDFNDLLQLDPNNNDAKTMLAEAKTGLGRLVGEISQEQLAALTGKCQTLYEKARALATRNTPPSIQQAINVFQQTIAADPLDKTGYNSKSQSAITSCKQQLHNAARPLRDEGKRLAGASDWLGSRAKYRQATATDPYDPNLTNELNDVQGECIKTAKHLISEAEAYMEATNFQEAMKDLQTVLKYADQESDKEHQKAIEMINRIRRNKE